MTAESQGWMRVRKWWWLVLALAVVAAACGGNDDDGSADTAAPAEAQEQTAADPIPTEPVE